MKKLKEELKRISDLSNVKVGDTLYLLGCGEVECIRVEGQGKYPITIGGNGIAEKTFTKAGKRFNTDLFPTLFTEPVVPVPKAYLKALKKKAKKNKPKALFANAKVGDKVFSIRKGVGEITEITSSIYDGIAVLFNESHTEYYSVHGKWVVDDLYPEIYPLKTK